MAVVWPRVSSDQSCASRYWPGMPRAGEARLAGVEVGLRRVAVDVVGLQQAGDRLRGDDGPAPRGHEVPPLGGLDDDALALHLEVAHRREAELGGVAEQVGLVDD